MKIKKEIIPVVLIILSLIVSIPIYADNTDSVLPQQQSVVDDDLFDTIDTEPEAEDPFGADNESVEDDTFEPVSEIGSDVDNSDSFWKDLKFTYSHKMAFSTDDSEFIINRSQLRGEWENLISPIWFAKVDADLSLFFPKDHIAKAKDKDLETDGSIRELYLQAAFESFSLGFGKQIIVWGETDGGIINDVISPRDNSEFIFIDLEDSRIGQYMIEADFYSRFGDFQLFSILLPEIGKKPGNNTRYEPGIFPATLKNISQDPELFDFETGLKWKKTVDKFDFSLMAADLYMNEPVYIQNGATIYERYETYQFVGVGASFTTGNFLFKLDAAYKSDYSLQAVTATGFQKLEKDILGTGIAVEYDANGKYTMNVELNNQYIFDYDDSLSIQNENSTGFYYLFGRNFFNETLEFQYVFYYQIQETSAFQQVSLNYKITDDLELKCDYTHFNIGDKASTLWHYRNENRVGLNATFYF